MPSRPVSAFIVLFWLGTLGWFGYHEIWPILFPADTPPFTIELADEVTSEVGGPIRGPDVLWGIFRGEKRIGKAETRLRYIREDNTFEMETRIVDVKLLDSRLIQVVIPEMKNTYRLSRAGSCARFACTAKCELPAWKGKRRFPAKCAAKSCFEPV